MSYKPLTPRPVPPPINDSSMSHESWKLFQVIAEFVEGYERLRHIKPSVSIFGSARTKPDNPYYKLTQDIARLLSTQGFSIVTGGGPGVMEAGNKGGQEGNCFSIGLNIVLPREEAPNPFQDISLRFRHFFTRKVMFFKYSSAFVLMPGGYGTLDEIGEVLAMIQTGKTRKIPVILVCKDFWAPLVHWFEHTLLAQGMIDKDDLNLFTVVDKPEDVLSNIKEFYKGRSYDPTEKEKELLIDL